MTGEKRRYQMLQLLREGTAPISGTALAKHFGVPFYVLGPSSTIDPECATGGDIVIEEISGEEKSFAINSGLVELAKNEIHILAQ